MSRISFIIIYRYVFGAHGTQSLRSAHVAIYSPLLPLPYDGPELTCVPPPPPPFREEAPSNAESPTPSDAAETPARHSLLPQVAIPTSLATGSRTTDRPTRWTRKRIYDALSDSRPVHWISVLREWLSDFKVIQVLIVVVEAIWVVIHLLPVRGSASWPDFLPLASSSVWASFSLWLLTNVLVPLAFAFFCNVSKATILRNHNRVYSTRSVSVAASEESNIDYLSFCIARGLIGYIIYGNKVSVAGLLSRSAISKVNAAYPGRWVGMLIAASIGAVETLYQAVLRRQF